MRRSSTQTIPYLPKDKEALMNTLTHFPHALWSEILPGLWQGGTADDDTHHRSRFGSPAITTSDFDLVVTLYADANPVDWFVREIRFGFYDHDMSDFDIDDLLAIAKQTHRAWQQGARVLIRCQAGLNRSGLTMALVLMQEGYNPREAIDLIRARRGSSALCNERFERWLLESDPLLQVAS